MDTATACALVAGTSYKPTWTLDAVPYPLYEDAIALTVAFDAPNTDGAPDYPEVLRQSQTFYLHVADLVTPLDLHGAVAECLLHLEVHELREFLAVDGDAYRKPFHAHTTEGMRNWAARQRGLLLRPQADHLADVTIMLRDAAVAP